MAYSVGLLERLCDARLQFRGIARGLADAVPVTEHCVDRVLTALINASARGDASVEELCAALCEVWPTAERAEAKPAAVMVERIADLKLLERIEKLERRCVTLETEAVNLNELMVEINGRCNGLATSAELDELRATVLQHTRALDRVERGVVHGPT